ncbi:telomere-associated protein RIF1 isoform X2 [Zonotrichia albicollis]|uniref:telomere-associated protein RIF1 isoform X2 n=1 Tax=Zonotrichia albicollis TaxID=44394 RepID=UPI003D812174
MSAPGPHPEPAAPGPEPEPAAPQPAAGSSLGPLLRTLEDPDAPPGELTDAHLTIVSRLSGEGGKAFTAEFRKHFPQLCKVFKAHISSPNLELSNAALQALGFCTFNSNNTAELSGPEAQELLAAVNSVAMKCSDKNTRTRALWVISKQAFPPGIVRKEVSNVLSTLETILTKGEAQSVVVEYEALNVIIRLMEQAPGPMGEEAVRWARLILPLVVHSSHKVQLRGATALEMGMPLLLQRQPEVAAVTEHLMTTKLIAELQKLFSSKNETFVLKLWPLFVRLLGKTLHRSGSFINSLLQLEELGFRSSSPVVKKIAFIAWKSLIDNFALNPDILCSAKRLKLLMQPLSSIHVRTEALALTKLEVWWYLLVRLGPHLPSNFEQVCVPLIQSTLSVDPAAAFPGTPSRPSTPSLASATPGQKPGTPRAALGSPAGAQLCPSIQLLGMEMLLHFLMGPRAGEFARDNKLVLSLEPLQHPLLCSPSFFCKHAGTLLCAVRDGVVAVGKEVPDCLLSVIWKDINGFVRAAIEAGNKKEKGGSEVLTMLLQALKKIVSSNSLPVHKVLSLIDITVKELPPKVLGSPAYQVADMDLLNGTPALFLIQLPFQHGLLECCVTDERFFGILQALVGLALAGPTSALAFSESVLAVIEQSAAQLGSKEHLCRMWGIVVSPLTEWINQNNEVNQGDALEHNFSAVYSALLLPVSHIFPAQGFPQASLRSLLRSWAELYRALARCAALVPTAEENLCCEELCAKILAGLEGETPVELPMLDGLTHLVSVMVDCINFAPYGPKFQPKTRSPQAPTDWARKKKEPLGKLSSLLRLLLLLLESFHALSHGQRAELLLAPGLALLSALHSIVCHLCLPSLLGTALGTLAQPLALFYEKNRLPEVPKVYSNLNNKLEQLLAQILQRLQCPGPGRCDSELLRQLSPLLCAALQHRSRHLRQLGAQLWNGTFGRAATLAYPRQLRSVLSQAKKKIPLLLPGFESMEVSEESSGPFSELMEHSQLDARVGGLELKVGQKQGIVRDSILAQTSEAQSHGQERPSSAQAAPAKLKLEFPSPKTTSETLLEEEKSVDFVFIPPETKPRILTEHQKEVLRSKRADIPAMYNNLDASQDTSSFSQCSQSQEDSLEMPPAAETAKGDPAEQPQEENMESEGSHSEESPAHTSEEETKNERAEMVPEETSAGEDMETRSVEAAPQEASAGKENTSGVTKSSVGKENTSNVTESSGGKEDTSNVTNTSVGNEDTLDVTNSSVGKEDISGVTNSLAGKEDSLDVTNSSARKMDTSNVTKSSVGKEDTSDGHLDASSSAKNEDTLDVTNSSARNEDTLDVTNSSVGKEDTLDVSMSSAGNEDTLDVTNSSAEKEDSPDVTNSSAGNEDTLDVTNSSARKEDTSNVTMSSVGKEEDTPDVTNSSAGKEDTPDVTNSSAGKEDTPDVTMSSAGKEDTPDVTSSSASSDVVSGTPQPVSRRQSFITLERFGAAESRPFSPAPPGSVPELPGSPPEAAPREGSRDSRAGARAGEGERNPPRAEAAVAARRVTRRQSRMELQGSRAPRLQGRLEEPLEGLQSRAELGSAGQDVQRILLRHSQALLCTEADIQSAEGAIAEMDGARGQDTDSKENTPPASSSCPEQPPAEESPLPQACPQHKQLRRSARRRSEPAESSSGSQDREEGPPKRDRRREEEKAGPKKLSQGKGDGSQKQKGVAGKTTEGTKESSQPERAAEEWGPKESPALRGLEEEGGRAGRRAEEAPRAEGEGQGSLSTAGPKVERPRYHTRRSSQGLLASIENSEADGSEGKEESTKKKKPLRVRSRSNSLEGKLKEGQAGSQSPEGPAQGGDTRSALEGSKGEPELGTGAAVPAEPGGLEKQEMAAEAEGSGSSESPGALQDTSVEPSRADTSMESVGSPCEPEQDGRAAEERQSSAGHCAPGAEPAVQSPECHNKRSKRVKKIKSCDCCFKKPRQQVPELKLSESKMEKAELEEPESTQTPAQTPAQSVSGPSDLEESLALAPCGMSTPLHPPEEPSAFSLARQEMDVMDGMDVENLQGSSVGVEEQDPEDPEAAAPETTESMEEIKEPAEQKEQTEQVLPESVPEEPRESCLDSGEQGEEPAAAEKEEIKENGELEEVPEEPSAESKPEEKEMKELEGNQEDKGEAESCAGDAPVGADEEMKEELEENGIQAPEGAGPSVGSPPKGAGGAPGAGTESPSSLQARCTWSPSASPSTSILKRGAKRSQEDDSLSPANKIRRVSFANPIFQEGLADDIDRRSPVIRSHSSPSSRSLKILSNMQITEMAKESLPCLSEFVYPALAGCKAPVDVILPQITSNICARGLGQLIRAKNIKTVGDLSTLTALEIKTLPIRSPKVSNVKRALRGFHEQQVKSRVLEESTVLEDAEKPGNDVEEKSLSGDEEKLAADLVDAGSTSSSSSTTSSSSSSSSSEQPTAVDLLGQVQALAAQLSPEGLGACSGRQLLEMQERLLGMAASIARSLRGRWPCPPPPGTPE